MQIFSSLKEVIDATTKFIYETREADIKRTSPEEILNLFIAANRFGREAIAACCHKIYGPYYDTSIRKDYVANKVYKYYGLHYSRSSIMLSWYSFITSYAEILQVIAHEIAHDVGHKHHHDETFWQEYYKNCQIIGLISSDIKFENGMMEDKYNVRESGQGCIKGLISHHNDYTISFTTLDRRLKALNRHKVFCRDKVSKEYVIKQEYSSLTMDICALYQMNFRYLTCGHSTLIIEPWLCEPSEKILSSELIKPITLNDIRFYDYIYSN